MIPTIQNECSIFLNHSNGIPLLRNFSVKRDGFIRVKVRKPKKRTQLDNVFDEAFNYNNLKQRCIISYTESSIPNDGKECEPFYIFPIDGFKVMFSEMVRDHSQYNSTLELLQSKLGKAKSENIISDLLKYTYKTQDLSLALSYNCEIIIYNIPYFYAVKKSLIEDYADFIQN